MADEAVLLGGVPLNHVEPGQGRAAVGYRLAAHARGRGAATRPVRLLARWAFDTLALERLTVMCGPDNHASQAVAERCGFTREGVLRSHMPFKGPAETPSSSACGSRARAHPGGFTNRRRSSDR